MTHAVSAASKGDAVKPLHNASAADIQPNFRIVFIFRSSRDTAIYL